MIIRSRKQFSSCKPLKSTISQINRDESGWRWCSGRFANLGTAMKWIKTSNFFLKRKSFPVHTVMSPDGGFKINTSSYFLNTAHRWRECTGKECLGYWDFKLVQRQILAHQQLKHALVQCRSLDLEVCKDVLFYILFTKIYHWWRQDTKCLWHQNSSCCSTFEASGHAYVTTESKVQDPSVFFSSLLMLKLTLKPV